MAAGASWDILDVLYLGDIGFEPTTSCVSSTRSNQLS